MAQLVRAPPCHGGGRGFESRLGRYGSLAQLGEHLPYKQRVTGSSPVTPIFLCPKTNRNKTREKGAAGKSHARTCKRSQVRAL